MPLSLGLLLFLSAADSAAVVRLGDDLFARRETARVYLSGRGWEARPALRAGMDGKDAEAARACRLLHADALDRECDRFEPVPEIDAGWLRLYTTDDEEHYRYDVGFYADEYARLVPYLDAVGRDERPWDNYRQACRLWIRDEVEAGADRVALKATVDEMRRRDDIWLRDHPP